MSQMVTCAQSCGVQKLGAVAKSESGFSLCTMPQKGRATPCWQFLSNIYATWVLKPPFSRVCRHACSWITGLFESIS